MKFYLTGQDNFGNRGCEALVRSNVMLLRERFPTAEFLVPSFNIQRDKKQWLTAEQDGIRFVKAIPVASALKWHGRFAKRIDFLKGFPWPKTGIESTLAKDIKSADALISIGGDNYSLDYGLVSLFHFINIAEFALRNNKPAALWAASVGPFDKEPRALPQIVKHLNRLSMVSVRETNSYEYLRSKGVASNLIQVADSAFAMVPEAFDITPFMPESDRPVLGLNVSPLIQRYREKGESSEVLKLEVANFIRYAVNAGYSVMLIPHVMPLDGSAYNNDEVYMQSILAMVGKEKVHVSMPSNNLNAAQLKYLISKCHYFIGARTHATIAAFSTLVPTISIAYSVKAKGINNDLFGDSTYVLDTPDVSFDSLVSSLQLLEKNDAIMREKLSLSVPIMRERARSGVQQFSRFL
ncbi:polysaccharide pyruvyl transferase family protein [Deefgea rivuli]|uniref:polysaccharide pyruvyl transferase family protein n=1 Tax=Deefgea rivuli TaxID=400948 RepID=UPI000487FC25|nr:polysaccharide pyruvyl transferase family protein [Deefgea rivuli]